MNRPPSPLYHFTCSDHGLPGIRNQGGLLIPNIGVRRITPTPIVWLTSDPEAAREDIGLSSTILTCDRMEARCEVKDTRRCMPWSYYAARRGVPVLIRDMLEFETKPDTWWVSEHPLRVTHIEILGGQGHE